MTDYRRALALSTTLVEKNPAQFSYLLQKVNARNRIAKLLAISGKRRKRWKRMRNRYGTLSG